MGNAGMAMQSKYRFLNRATGEESPVEIRPMSSEAGSFDNAMGFLDHPMPSLFYGVYCREKLLPLFRPGPFDGLDLFVILHFILRHGVNTFPLQLYTVGIDTETYEHKVLQAASGRLYAYWPYTARGLDEIWKAPRLSFGQKLALSECFLRGRAWSFARYERHHRPLQARMVGLLGHLYDGIRARAHGLSSSG